MTSEWMPQRRREGQAIETRCLTSHHCKELKNGDWLNDELQQQTNPLLKARAFIIEK